MWVIIKKPFAGVLCGAMFQTAGGKNDLTEGQIAELRKILGKENVIDVCAPWDEHKDHKAVAAAKRKAKANAAIAKVESIKARLVELRKVAAEINVLKKELDDAERKAEFLAKEAKSPAV